MKKAILVLALILIGLLIFGCTDLEKIDNEVTNTNVKSEINELSRALEDTINTQFSNKINFTVEDNSPTSTHEIRLTKYESLESCENKCDLSINNCYIIEYSNKTNNQIIYQKCLNIPENTNFIKDNPECKQTGPSQEKYTISQITTSEAIQNGTYTILPTQNHNDVCIYYKK